MIDNKQPDVKCSLYGNEPCEDCRITITCNNGGSIPTETPLKEVFARFQQRPESAWGMFRRLSRVYSVNFTGKVHCKMCEIDKFKYTNIFCSVMSLLDLPEQEAITIMQQIEKDLKE